MKIKQTEIIYDNGEEFYCIDFDDGTYVCLTKSDYQNLLELIEKATTSEVNNFIRNSSAQHTLDSSKCTINDFFTFLSALLVIGFIYLFVKIWYSLPWIIGLLIFVMGVIITAKSVNSGNNFNFIYAIITCIISVILFILTMFFLHFMSHLGHIGMTAKDISRLHEVSGFNQNQTIGLLLTIPGSFFIGGFIAKK